MAGIYIHIPFCKQACYYCDFHFSTDQRYRNELCTALAKEIELQKNYFEAGTPIETLYFGGGTPSLLSIHEFDLLLNTFYKHFSISTTTEITCEANPDDLTKEKLKNLRYLNINRLSIGIQSFQDEVLQFLNRAHNHQNAMQCIDHARESGFHNISIDLIYAIPNQSDQQWLNNIEKAIALRPEHISSYSLTIEEKTVFGRWQHRGKIHAMDDERTARQLEMLVTLLEAAGYDQYEVSNFGKPGFYSRHNSSYWKGEAYLGIGPSAHSYNRETRQFNVANNHLYMKSIRENKIPYEQEVLTRENKINDYLLTTLRTSWGADLAWLEQALHYNVIELHGKYIHDLEGNGLARIANNQLILTRKGMMLADKISADLFVL